MADVTIHIWDVERGDAILIKGPQKNVVLDVGSHRGGFSPSRHIHNQHGIELVDYLVLSHPDADHIDDLPEFLDIYSPAIIATRDEARPYIRRRKNQLYPTDENYQRVTDAYLKLTEDYTSDPEVSPRNPEWNGGLTIQHKMVPEKALNLTPVNELSESATANLNNLSIASILQYGDFQMVTLGDLEASAIETLLAIDGVRQALSGTDVLLAPHHGRESSYTPELFKTISPEIVAISDAKAGTTNASSRYSTHAGGHTVNRRKGGLKSRNVVTTRKDGVITITTEGDSFSVTID